MNSTSINASNEPDNTQMITIIGVVVGFVIMLLLLLLLYVKRIRMNRMRSVIAVDY